MLQGLSVQQRQALKRAFIENGHPRFLKCFAGGMPYGYHAVYKKWVMRGSLEKLTDLIKICGFLLQTKAYLFWRKTEAN
jgi:hypothetical protein